VKPYLNSNVLKIWTWVLLAPLILEAIALYYQYGLDYGPCTLCVQIRATLTATIILGLLGLLLKNMLAQRVFSLIFSSLMIFFLYQCYLLLGIERSWFESSCTLTNAFPAWMPLDQWLPSMFEPWELCGYTPYIVGSISMAEILLLTAVISVLVSLYQVTLCFRHRL